MARPSSSLLALVIPPIIFGHQPLCSGLVHAAPLPSLAWVNSYTSLNTQPPRLPLLHPRSPSWQHSQVHGSFAKRSWHLLSNILPLPNFISDGAGERLNSDPLVHSPKCLPTARAGPGRGQEPRNLHDSSMWVAGTQGLGLPPSISQSLH